MSSAYKRYKSLFNKFKRQHDKGHPTLVAAEILGLLEDGFTGVQIAAYYGVAPALISKVKTGKHALAKGG